MFKIDIYNIPLGSHEYEFDFDESFFSLFDDDLLSKGSGKILVNLSKSESFLDLSFEISGEVELVCDRSLDPFDYTLDISKSIILKFGNEEDVELDINDDISFIPWNTQRIELDQYVFEFIALEIPAKKLHPRYDDDLEDVDDTLVYSSESDEDMNPSSDIDPRWNMLKNLDEDDKEDN